MAEITLDLAALVQHSAKACDDVPELAHDPPSTSPDGQRANGH
ncbi:hypothetical protein [Allokutzneria oryzae]|uniref:Uncharacterized protein n=1 Tax=Allokutzneria oryzae TaxID=1378989 RepID=A0ABV5ZXI5_9PSEU